MAKIVMVGAGSVVFGRNLLADILSHEALAESEIVLVDIDSERLATALGMAQSISASLGSRARLSATKDRRRALAGADFVLCTIGVGGIAATRDDLQIPLRFGVRQVVGDTLGVGGIFRSARSIPHVLRLCADMERLCPQAWLLNYTNPMAMHCLAIQRATRVRCVGLCHGVVNTANTLRAMIALMDRPAREITRHFQRPWGAPARTREWLAWMEMGKDPNLRYTCAGINHMAFFLRFESGGTDLYPRLRELVRMPHLFRLDPVRLELFRWLGYFMTETAGHTAEYTPYFLKSEQETAARHLQAMLYLSTCRYQERAYSRLVRDIRAGAALIPTPYVLSHEYASRIMNALVTGTTFAFNGNMHNRGGALISNLPGDCCVEVPCVAGPEGIVPLPVGDLPPQCAALIRTNVNVQDLTVRGILEDSLDYLYQAAMLDPNTASTLTLGQIETLCDALVAAHRDRLSPRLRFRNWIRMNGHGRRTRTHQAGGVRS